MSLWNHNQKCKERQLPSTSFPYSLQNIHPNSLQGSEIIRPICRHMIHDRAYDISQGRIDESRIMPESSAKNVENGDIINAIRKLIERLDQYYQIECIKKGGSLTDIVLRELKEDHGIDLLKQEREEEEEEEEIKIKTDEVAEEIFHDVVSKDKKKLEKMLDNLSQEYDFSELAMEIKEIHILLRKQKRRLVII